MMKFEDIQYEHGIGKYAGTIGIVMPGGFWVFKKTMTLAWTTVHANWANIDWWRKETAKSMIGVENWGSPEEHGLNQALGRCIAFFARQDMLPLPLVLAKKRNGMPYKGGKRLYVPADAANSEAVPVMASPACRIAKNRHLIAHVNWAALLKSAQPTLIGELS